MLREWEDIPRFMQCDEVREYYDILARKRVSLGLKKMFDVIVAAFLLVVLAVPMMVIGIVIVLESPGGAFYRQERVTSYGRRFRIHKFRTMVVDAERIGPMVTVSEDSRVTSIGVFLRKYRLDELPQLIDVLAGDMSFVGTRPEVVKYVRRYTKEMRATLLLPAGITSEASIRYKDEARFMDGAEDVDRVYVEEVLPGKMRCNLEGIRRYSFFRELGIMVRTVWMVFGEGKSGRGWGEKNG